MWYLHKYVQYLYIYIFDIFEKICVKVSVISYHIFACASSLGCWVSISGGWIFSSSFFRVFSGEFSFLLLFFQVKTNSRFAFLMSACKKREIFTPLKCWKSDNCVPGAKILSKSVFFHLFFFFLNNLLLCRCEQKYSLQPHLLWSTFIFRTTLSPIEQTIEFQIPSSKNPRDLKISSLGWFDGENRNRAKTGLCQFLATHGFLFGGSLRLTDWKIVFLGVVSDWQIDRLSFWDESPIDERDLRFVWKLLNLSLPGLCFVSGLSLSAPQEMLERCSALFLGGWDVGEGHGGCLGRWHSQQEDATMRATGSKV